MPQLDTSVYVTQIFWLLVTFISFWFIMGKIMIPKIGEKIEERKRKYDDYIQKAEEINQKALNSLKNYEEKLAEAMSNATSKIDANEKELEIFMIEKQNKFNMELKQQFAENEKKITQEIGEIMGNIDNMADNVALIIADNLNLNSLNKDSIKDFIEETGSK